MNPKRDGGGVEVRLADLPLAPLVGYADGCSVALDRGIFDISFVDRATKRVIARFVVAKGDPLNTFLSISEEFLNVTKRWIDAQGLTSEPPSLDAIGEPSLIGQPVNLFRIGRLGHEAEIEGFYVPVNAVSHTVQKPDGGPVPVAPVARIYLRLTLAVGLLEYLESQRVTE